MICNSAFWGGGVNVSIRKFFDGFDPVYSCRGRPKVIWTLKSSLKNKNFCDSDHVTCDMLHVTGFAARSRCPHPVLGDSIQMAGDHDDVTLLMINYR